MKTKSTAIWFALAALLFAFIWFGQKYWRSAAPTVARLLPGLRIADVTNIEVVPVGVPAINAVRTNGGWRLTKPFVYPAQAAAIENLLSALVKLTPATRLTAAETSLHKNTDAEFGFDSPRFTVVISTRQRQWQLSIGNKTAPGDQVFVRVADQDGAFVTGVNWLPLLPANATGWRDTSLMDMAGSYNLIVITNGTKVIELRRDPTSRLWRMTRPLSARADSDRIATALQQLRSAPAARFVTDDPKADLTTFGLQPAELDLGFGRGTNLTAGLQVGKATSKNPAQVYVQREGWSSVVAVTNDVFAPWRGSVNDFRDPRLIDLTSPVAEIEVQGKGNFTLQEHGSNDWTLVGEKFPIAAGSVRNFVRLLASFRIAEFVKDNNTTTDLQGFGLAAPGGTNRITLRSVVGDTNHVIAQIIFGTVETNKVYVKRGDENYVYALARHDFNQLRLLENGWIFRSRRIWDFAETNIAQITLRQNGKTRTLIRVAAGSWLLAAGSAGPQGSLNSSAIEEAAHGLSALTALGWIGHNFTAADGGFNPGNLQITVELKTGEKLSVNFGAELPSAKTAVAAVTLDGARWAFVFPPKLFQLVTGYLTIPVAAP